MGWFIPVFEQELVEYLAPFANGTDCEWDEDTLICEEITYDFLSSERGVVTGVAMAIPGGFHWFLRG